MVSLLFLMINAVAIVHSYKFTHFADADIPKKNPRQATFTEKLSLLLFGINNPRPTLTHFPAQEYEVIKLQSNVEIECWRIKRPDAKGTVILFHGYGGNKSLMLDKSDEFLKLGYNTFLVDFMGSGGSEGNCTTIGYKEAEQVKTAYYFIKTSGESNIHLFGTSMGAVAILKSIKDYKISPSGIIIECPFGSMYETVCARFNDMNIPQVPMAGMLVFWGGVQNGYWAFGHNPTEYAKYITCPVLLLYGKKDNRVSMEETEAIFKNLTGKKELTTYPLAGHENYLIQYRDEWINSIRAFLEK